MAVRQRMSKARADDANDPRVIRGLVDVRSPSAEPFRMLRLAIDLRPKVETGVQPPIVFTSADAGEGKSTVAANYALVAAQNDRRVLLIDADLRKPTQHRLFGVRGAPGLTEVIAANMDFATLVKPIQTEPGVLHLLTAGTRCRMSVTSSPRMPCERCSRTRRRSTTSSWSTRHHCSPRPTRRRLRLAPAPTSRSSCRMAPSGVDHPGARQAGSRRRDGARIRDEPRGQPGGVRLLLDAAERHPSPAALPATRAAGGEPARRPRRRQWAVALALGGGKVSIAVPLALLPVLLIAVGGLLAVIAWFSHVQRWRSIPGVREARSSRCRSPAGSRSTRPTSSCCSRSAPGWPSG